MTLIASISGIRGTLGGKPQETLSPLDIVRFTSAYGKWVSSSNQSKTIVIGRDARPSGKMVSSLVSNTLISMGLNVIDLEVSTTPTVEMAVPAFQAAGGIIITASHNPVNWNALKMLNHKGEFISEEVGKEILKYYQENDFQYVEIENFGKITHDNFMESHLKSILDLPLVDVKAIQDANFSIAVDGINSGGGIYVPALLEKLGVKNIVKIHCEPTGWFAHNPEPLKAHLAEICELVKSQKLDLGIVVDPDVDRLAFIDNQGEMFGEEYTLVAVADYVLSVKKGAAVSNLSSSRALRDVCEKHGQNYEASAVGEVNVVKKMKEINALIGGEGNGGVILPDLHYGRDALVGIALFLTHLAKSKLSCAELKKTYPSYQMAKEKLELTPQTDLNQILSIIAKHFENEKVNLVDGVKIDFADSWVHLRKSNTEPILRIYTEAKTEEKAIQLANEMKELIKTKI